MAGSCASSRDPQTGPQKARGFDGQDLQPKRMRTCLQKFGPSSAKIFHSRSRRARGAVSGHTPGQRDECELTSVQAAVCHARPRATSGNLAVRDAIELAEIVVEGRRDEPQSVLLKLDTGQDTGEPRPTVDGDPVG